MRALTNEEALRWCTDRGLVWGGNRLRFPNSPPTAIVLPLKHEPSRLPWLGLYLLDIDVDVSNEYLLWIRDWDVATDLMVEIGVGHFDRLRSSYGISLGLRTTPGMLLNTSEFEAIAAFSMFPLLFGWDAYLIPAVGDHVAFVSHEEHAAIITRDEESQAVQFEKTKEWKPRIDSIPRWA